MKKRMITLLMLLAMITTLVACGTTEEKEGNQEVAAGNVEESNDAQDEGVDNSLQYILDKGEFVLGLDDSFPPMGFRDDANNIVGFDIDLAKAVADKLGVTLTLQPIEWVAKEQELNTKNIDCIWNGFSITEERLQNSTLSKPYLENTISLVVLKDSGITTMDDMAGKRLAVQGGSSAEDALNAEDAKEFRESVEVNSFSDYVTALMDMETGNSDAVLMDSVVANYMIAEGGKDFAILDENLVGEEYAIGFRKGEEELKNAVETALSELKAEGKIEEIATEWFGSDITLIQ